MERKQWEKGKERPKVLKKKENDGGGQKKNKTGARSIRNHKNENKNRRPAKEKEIKREKQLGWGHKVRNQAVNL